MRLVRPLKRCGALCAALLLAACGSSGDEGATIDIGVLYSTGGPSTQGQLAMANGAELAAEQINAAGGVLGKKLKVIAHDIHEDAGMGKQLLKQLAEQGVVAVEGPFVPPASVAAAPEAEQLKVPMFAFVPDPSFTAMRYVFNTLPQVELQANIIAKRAMNAKQTHMAFLSDMADASTSALIEKHYTDLGGMVTSRHTIDVNTDFVALLNDVFKGMPDAIAVSASQDVLKALLNAFLLHFPPSQTFWRLVGACVPEFDKGVPSFNLLRQEAITQTDEGGGPVLAAYDKAYLARFPDAPFAYGQAMFDAVYTTALAMEAAKSADRAALRDNLVPVSKGGTAYTFEHYKEAVAAIARGEDVDYQGASQAFDWDDNGDITLESAVFTTCLGPPNMRKIFSYNDAM